MQVEIKLRKLASVERTDWESMLYIAFSFVHKFFLYMKKDGSNFGYFWIVEIVPKHILQHIYIYIGKETEKKNWINLKFSRKSILISGNT